MTSLSPVSINSDFIINNEKINRTFMKDEAYNKLSEWIVSGKLKPETKLRINELSELLGISRTPVREALLKLENDGLILTKANRWTIVSPINFDEANDIFPIVSALETLALKQAFPKMNKKKIKTLENINSDIYEYQEEGDYATALKVDNDFNNKIIEFSENHEIPSITDSLKKRIQRIHLIFLDDEEKVDYYQRNKKITDALKNNDFEGSIQALKDKWSDFTNLLNKHM